MKFRVQGKGLRMLRGWNLGFRLQGFGQEGLGSRILGFRSMACLIIVYGLWFMASDFGLGSELWVWGFRFWVSLGL